MPALTGAPTQYGAYEVDLTGVAAVTGGAILALLNPEGADLLLVRTVVDLLAKATGAANINIGIGASPTTSYSNVLAATAAGGGGAGVIDSLPALGAVKWPAAQYLTVSGSASTVGLVGRLYLDYFRAKGA